MSYLIFFLLTAFLGIGWLWFHQKRQRATMDTVDGFRASLERLSEHSVAIPDREDQVNILDRQDEEHAPSGSQSSSRRPEPLDPVRREAARRRLQARRSPGTTQ